MTFGGLTPEAIPAFTLMRGFGLHVQLGLLQVSAHRSERPGGHGEGVTLGTGLVDGSHAGSLAFPGGYPMGSERLASRAILGEVSVQEAQQAL